MTAPHPSLLRRLRRSDRGGTIVEYALSVALFLLLLFAALDFGRMLYNWNMAEKAMQLAARTAAVRNALPAALCGGVEVPATNLRGALAGSTPYGRDCRRADGANLCGTAATQSIQCTLPDALAAANACTFAAGAIPSTQAEIWCRIQPILPHNARPSNIRVRYDFDPRMNFLGGPYVPTVTVELQNLNFSFISPLMGLASAAAGASMGPEFGAVPFPSMSVSLPGEDLALGDAG